MKEIYIVAAKRTVIGKFMGCFSNTPAADLGGQVIKNVIENTKIEPREINEIIMGQVLVGGLGQNPIRQAGIKAGVPVDTPSFGVSQVCGSGLKAVILAAQAIKAGDARLMIAGGQENMSMAKHAGYLRNSVKFGDFNFVDMMQYDGLTDVFSNVAMGITAENIAKKYNISRVQQDEFAMKSQRKAADAASSGKFNEEIVPIEITSKKEKIIVDKDEGIRLDTTIEGLAKLKAAFDKEGSVTAGNASTINDGAACVMLMNSEMIAKYNLTPLARVVSYATSGVDPNFMGEGPIYAVKKALSIANWNINSLDLIESNEAFAAQSICVSRELGWDESKVNVNGGAIALGHPIGASGARILVTLLHEMTRRNLKRGLATLCIGGGMGVCLTVER